ncbi:hypothetical protein AB1283_23380 [Bacillus sp. S13(2024)]|uniref:hypothetical protein n=1 Tax=unclassified Bacillus (in: firmicutes) TaxID=185979 RepID=UPI003D1C833C
MKDQQEIVGLFLLPKIGECVYTVEGNKDIVIFKYMVEIEFGFEDIEFISSTIASSNGACSDLFKFSHPNFLCVWTSKSTFDQF